MAEQVAVRADETLRLPVWAYDPDHCSLPVEIADSPAGAAIDRASTLVWTPVSSSRTRHAARVGGRRFATRMLDSGRERGAMGSVSAYSITSA